MSAWIVVKDPYKTFKRWERTTFKGSEYELIYDDYMNKTYLMKIEDPMMILYESFGSEDFTDIKANLENYLMMALL